MRKSYSNSRPRSRNLNLRLPRRSSRSTAADIPFIHKESALLRGAFFMLNDKLQKFLYGCPSMIRRNKKTKEGSFESQGLPRMPECHKILPCMVVENVTADISSVALLPSQFKTCTACGSLVPVSQLFCACGKFLPLQKDAITEADVETAYQNGLFAGIAEERERNEKEWACFFADAGLKDTFTNKAIANREDFYAWKKSFDEDCLRRARAAAQSKFEHLAENMTAAMKIREKTLDFIKRYNASRWANKFLPAILPLTLAVRMSTLPMALILAYLNNFVTTIPPRSVYIKESLPLYPAMMFLSI